MVAALSGFPERFREIVGGVIVAAWVGSLVLGVTAFALAVPTWLAVQNIRATRRTHSAGPAFYATARLGLALTIGVVAEAVFRAPEVPVSFRGVLYVLGLAMVSVGYSGVIVYERRRDRRAGDERVAR